MGQEQEGASYPTQNVVNLTAGLHGRVRIFTALEDINRDNVIEETNRCLALHFLNVDEMDYLDGYRRGIQPILNKKKEVRPEINHKIVVNNASFVVTFKNGYFLTKPCSYVARKDNKSDLVKELNEYLYASGKAIADNETVDWFHTVGLGAIYLESNEDPDAPVKAYALDPRCAFVVYSRRPGNEPVMAINIVTIDKTHAMIDVITKKKRFVISRAEVGMINATPFAPYAYEIKSETDNLYGEINIFEYSYNKNRMCAFEVAIPIMDAINEAESDRADSRTQFIQNLLVAVNTSFDEGTTANTIRQSGLICITSTNENKAEIRTISEQINEAETQVSINDLYEQMLEKCGVPSSVRDGGSTSDNVGAVYLRSGWASADTDCRNEEDLFRKSNSYFDRCLLAILHKKGLLTELKETDFALCFYRNDMTNLQAKTQAALAMKQLGFSPALTFERSGLSYDPIADVEMSKKYIDNLWNTQPPAQNGQNVPLTDQQRSQGQPDDTNQTSKE